MTPASPGRPNHSMHDPKTSSVPNAAIHGLRCPPASAIEPSTGDIAATTSPAQAVAKPHIACPSTGFAAMADAKNGA